MIKNEVWSVDTFKGSESVKLLLNFLLPEFHRMFSTKTMHAERCLIFNDPSAQLPMLIINDEPIRIRLVQNEPEAWAQTIYQLSHEMCHYAIRQGKINKYFTLIWLEEIICEAVSLYALKFSIKNWRQCPLMKRNKNYSFSLFKYLETQMNKESRIYLSEWKTIEQLKKYNDEATQHREGHREERNTLYSAILKNPSDCKCFCEIYQYLNADQLTINFEAWKENNSSRLISCLEQIHPRIFQASDNGN